MSTPHRASPQPGQDTRARLHNLPAPHMQLIGREKDSATIRKLVLQTSGRLVTLTGTGGCGKTQLALHVAAGLVDDFRDGVWLVELAMVQAAHLVPYAVAAVLGRHERAGEVLTDAIVAYLEGRELLLVLDNCEHLIDACADLAGRLVSDCPRVRLLATSRERLRIGAETTWRVPSLASPDPHGTFAPADLPAYPAIQLFVERAQAVQPDFVLGPSNASSVVDICARLEGLPLALELAAARVSALSVGQILERLDRSFPLLVGGSRTAPTRQQTLRATLDWSHGLLSVAEQAAFHRMTAFAGSSSVEAAEAVCSGDDAPPDGVLEVLSRLVDKSLVVMDERDGQAYYRLLEPTRQYAREKLVASGELELVQQRHATFYCSFAQRQERDASLGGPRRHLALLALLREYPNFQAALQWALDTRQLEIGFRLAGALQLLWRERGPYGEALSWITAMLNLPGAEAPTPGRAMALLIAAAAAWRLGDHVTTHAMYAEAGPLVRQLGDPWILFTALLGQGLDAQQRGDYAAARAFFTDGLTVTRATGDRISEARLLSNLGRLAIYETSYSEGRVRCREALSVGRSLGDVWLTSLALNALGLAALGQGELVEARELASECLNQPDAGITFTRTDALSLLGRVELAEGHFAEAREYLLEELALVHDSGPLAIAQALEDLASLAAHMGQSDRAVRLTGAATGVRERGGIMLYPVHSALREHWLGPVRRALGATAVERWWGEGSALSVDGAFNLALAEVAPHGSSCGRSDAVAPRQAGLTSREVGVLRLVAKGWTNKEIGSELVLSVRTVERHLANLYDKIDAHNKADATAYAFQHELL